jgi:glycosyltransferase involved in cell wall biosynthesis
MNPCLLIPIFDHKDTIRRVVLSVEALGLPCLVINDGSGHGTREVLDAIAKEFDWVEVQHHPVNRGKGVALRHGYHLAAARGFTHVLQFDADGQHDTRDARRFLEAARRDPDAMVLGEPVFDASAPRSRIWSRKLSVGLVWLATLSRRVRDPLCGFRCLPLGATLPLVEATSMGNRMDFDPELAVRLVWKGMRVVTVPTRVRYFADGLSHFDVVWDDLRLASLYLRLTLRMLVSLPAVLVRRLRGRDTWERA